MTIRHILLLGSGAFLFALISAAPVSGAEPSVRELWRWKFPAERASIDGSGNNVANPEWGAAHEPLIRIAEPWYEDGVSSPAGVDRPNPRAVSNALMSQSGLMPNEIGYSDWLWQWGQFVDHDIVRTPAQENGETFPITIPMGDPQFDPFFTGTAEMDLRRSEYEMVGGVREQMNAITSYIDASNVYGSSEERALALRTLDGTGRLATSAGNLMPFNVNALENDPTPFAPIMFLAGDTRSNEQLGLIAIHTLWVREHNYWADRLYQAFNAYPRRSPGPLSGDEIYERARIIVTAEMQHITYNEFLPVLLGEGAISPYRGYNRYLDASISNEFATAVYRVGHTLLSPDLQRLNEHMRPTEDGPISLAGSFFVPFELISSGGIEPFLRGLAGQRAQELDHFLIDDVRNFLFGPPGFGGFDLASLNIQRGREHGLPSLNQFRREVGLDPYNSFDEMCEDAATVSALEQAYGDIELVDMWAGGLCEDPVPGALVGETFFFVLTEQFEALRDGDRFYYKNYLPRGMQYFIETQRLSDIIRRNSPIGDEIPDNVFMMPEMQEPPIKFPSRLIPIRTR